MLRVGLLVREVGAEHQQRVAVLHRPVVGGEAQEPVMPTSNGLSCSMNSLPLRASTIGAPSASARARARTSSRAPSTPAPAWKGHVLAGVQRGGCLLQLHRGGHGDGVRAADGEDPLVDGVFQCGVAGHHEHGDAPLFDGRAHRNFQQSRHLVGAEDHFAEDAAVAEQFGGPGFLEVLAADLVARDVRGDREHGNPAAVRIVEPVDQVHVAGAAAACTHCEVTRQRCLASGRERSLLSCRVSIHSMPFSRRIASVTAFRESPGTPQIRWIPLAARLWTTVSAIVGMLLLSSARSDGRQCRWRTLTAPEGRRVRTGLNRSHSPDNRSRVRLA